MLGVSNHSVTDWHPRASRPAKTETEMEEVFPGRFQIHGWGRFYGEQEWSFGKEEVMNGKSKVWMMTTTTTMNDDDDDDDDE